MAHHTSELVRSDSASSPPALFVLLVTVLILIVPVIIAEHPPLIDFPNHLARHYIGATIDRSTHLQEFYVYHWRPVANLAADVIYIFLSAILSPLDSERAIVGIAIAAWATAPVVLNRAIWGTWSIGPCLAGLVVYNASLQNGLENFLIASAASVFCFALWIQLRNHLTFWRVILFCLLTSIVYFGHLLAFVVLGLLVGPYELQRAVFAKEYSLKRLGELGIAAIPFFPGIIFFIVFNLTTRTSGEFETVYGGVGARIYAALSPVLMYHPFVDLFALLTVGCVLGWRMLIVPARAVHPSLICVLLVLFVACLLVPAIILDIRAMHLRLPAILIAILIASIDWRPVIPQQWRVICAVCACAMILRAGSVASYWLVHSAEVRELRKSFEKIEHGSTVLAAVNEQADTGVFHWFSLSYAVLDRNIFTPALYPDIHMLSVKPKYRRLTRLVATPVALSMLSKPDDDHCVVKKVGDYWSTWWKDFSYILVLSRKPIEAGFNDHLSMVAEGSFFRLYSIQHLAAKQCSPPRAEF